MKVLVVGGAGYIGSHVCKALKEKGFCPVVYDNLSTGHAWAVQFGPFVQADVNDEQKLDLAFQEFQPQAVVFLASLINVRDSISHPLAYYENNLLGALSLLKAMIRHQVFSLVFSSTAAVYGTPETVPIREDHKKAPLNAYGKTKWAIEMMLEDFSRAYGLRFAALRYFNACGADAGGALGEAHHPETHLIPLALRAALRGQQLKVYGDTYSTPDGTAIRDYIHVSDLAEAHLRALQYLFAHPNSLQTNLGTGQGYSVYQILRAVEEITQAKVSFEIAPRLPYDSPALIADPSLARQILNWHPRFSDLNTIISTALNWENKGHLLYN